MNDLVRKTEVINELVALTSYKTKLEITKAIEADLSKMDKWLGGVEDSLHAIEAIQPVDAVPVVHGYNKQIKFPGQFTCSVCGWESWDTYCGDTDTYNYCPYCGAKMDGTDGERKDEEH